MGANYAASQANAAAANALSAGRIAAAGTGLQGAADIATLGFQGAAALQSGLAMPKLDVRGQQQAAPAAQQVQGAYGEGIGAAMLQVGQGLKSGAKAAMAGVDFFAEEAKLEGRRAATQYETEMAGLEDELAKTVDYHKRENEFANRSAVIREKYAGKLSGLSLKQFDADRKIADARQSTSVRLGINRDRAHAKQNIEAALSDPKWQRLLTRRSAQDTTSRRATYWRDLRGLCAKTIASACTWSTARRERRARGPGYCRRGSVYEPHYVPNNLRRRAERARGVPRSRGQAVSRCGPAGGSRAAPGSGTSKTREARGPKCAARFGLSGHPRERRAARGTRPDRQGSDQRRGNGKAGPRGKQSHDMGLQAAIYLEMAQKDPKRL